MTFKPVHSHKHTHDKVASGSCGHHHGDLLQRKPANSPSNNIALALALNLSFAAIELIGGAWTQSSAIQADAIHDFGDSTVLAMALVFQVFSRIKPSPAFNFGFKRLSLVSAFSTSLLLFLSSVYLIYFSSQRFFAPVTPHLSGMFWLAVLGVFVNGFAAWRVSGGATQNEKAITWHMLEDIIWWIAVLISSIIMGFVDVPWLDPLLAVAIAAMVLWGSGRNLWASFRLFLQATPTGISEMQLSDAISKVSGVKAIKKLQLWSLDGDHHICSGQIQVEPATTFNQWVDIRAQIDQNLSLLGNIESTLEPVQI